MGADVSIINRNFLPSSMIIEDSGIKVRSACGNRLQIVGRVRALPITWKGKLMEISPLVTPDEPRDYVILGADVIKEHSRRFHEFFANVLLNRLGVEVRGEKKHKTNFVVERKQTSF